VISLAEQRRSCSSLPLDASSGFCPSSRARPSSRPHLAGRIHQNAHASAQKGAKAHASAGASFTAMTPSKAKALAIHQTTKLFPRLDDEQPGPVDRDELVEDVV